MSSSRPILPTFADIQDAARQIAGVAHRTPVVTSQTINAGTGARVHFKCENLQRAGAFKIRGAYNAMSRLSPEERRRGVLTFSSGNHAQAVALAGRVLGIPTVIVMPSDAPPVKKAATEGYGGDVIIYDRDRDDRETIGRRLALERGLTVIPPYDHAAVIAGQCCTSSNVRPQPLQTASPCDVEQMAMQGASGVEAYHASQASRAAAGSVPSSASCSR